MPRTTRMATSSAVQITGDLNTSVAGQYELTYSVQDSIGNQAEMKKRVIIVTEIVVETDETPPVLILLGDRNITLFLEESFVESGFNATDNKDGNISDRVVVSGTVDTLNVGSYELSYAVTDDAGNQSEILTRIVTMIERPVPVDEVAPLLNWWEGKFYKLLQVPHSWNQDITPWTMWMVILLLRL